MRVYLNRFLLTCCLLLCWQHFSVYGQVIQGQTFDAADNKPLEDVVITNIFTTTDKIADKTGRFSIEAQAGQLVEFRKEGYKVLRVRIPQGKLPVFKVVMEKYDPSIAHFENNGSPDYKADSIKYALIYKKELEYPQLSGLDVVRHPFSAMSKKNQQIWAFQKEFAATQQQKYIDYVFNDQLITALTGLTGDSLQIYRKMFRPSYNLLRSMNDYVYFNYIKRTVTLYRQRGIRARQSPSRLTH